MTLIDDGARLKWARRHRDRWRAIARMARASLDDDREEAERLAGTYFRIEEWLSSRVRRHVEMVELMTADQRAALRRALDVVEGRTGARYTAREMRNAHFEGQKHGTAWNWRGVDHAAGVATQYVEGLKR